MNSNIAIIGNNVIVDPPSVGGKKWIAQFIVRSSVFLNDILAEYKNTKDGSLAQDVSTGEVYYLLGGRWVKLGG